MSMIRCRLVTFDVVRTLLRVIGSPAVQYAKAAQQHGMFVEADSIQSVYAPVYREMKLDHPVYGLHQGMDTRQWWAQFVHRIFNKLGHHDDAQLAAVCDQLWDQFSEGANWEPLPNTLPTLDLLKHRGFSLAAVSNFDERLDRTLQRQNMRQYFDFLITVPIAGAEKPDPRVFNKAVELAGVQPAHMVHVGDDVSDDYHGARRVGINPILFDAEAQYITRHEEVQIHKEHIITDIRQLPDKLELLDIG